MRTNFTNSFTVAFRDYCSRSAGVPMISLQRTAWNLTCPAVCRVRYRYYYCHRNCNNAKPF